MTQRMCILVLFLMCSISFLHAQPATHNITTVAGNGTEGFGGDGGLATEAQLYYPEDVFVDTSGNLYIADYVNHRIRKVDTNGIITTLTGNGTAGFSGDDGPATQASIDNPTEVCVDLAGNIFFTDSGNDRIRKIDKDGIITTVAGNGVTWGSKDEVPAIETSLNGPNGIYVDTQGNLYIAERWKHQIRKVDTNGIITTVAGNGTNAYEGDGGQATKASLSNPTGVFVNPSGEIYIADGGNNRIRKVDAFGIITTVAGNGTEAFEGDGGQAIQASLVRPHDIFGDPSGNIFFSTTSNLVSGASSYRVRKVDTNGIISTVAGNGKSSRDFTEGEPATEASLNALTGICLDTQGNLYIAAVRDHAVRKVDNVSPSAPLIPSGNLALTLDGQGDFAQIDGQFTFSTTNQITLEAWFKLDNNSTFESVISAGVHYRLMLDTAMHPYWNAGLHADRSDNTFTFNTGQWYHYALVVEGGIEAKLYVDGNLINSHTSQIPATLPDVSQFLLGAGESSDLYNLNGQIDEIRIWNIARTEKELQELRTRTLTGQEHGLVGYWTFDEQNQGDWVKDHSAGQNNAFLGGDAYLNTSTSPISGESHPEPPIPTDPPQETAWRAIETETQDAFFSVFFTDAHHGWAVGSKGQILATTDGGTTGIFQNSGITSYTLYGLHFIDNHTGWIAADRGTLLHTSDGGNTWTKQNAGTSLKLFDVQFIDANIGWAVGDWRTILHTTDGGHTWTKQTVPNISGPHINAIHMLTQQIGWATSATSLGNRSLIGTTDGGNTWTMLMDGSGTIVRDIYFSNENEGWMVGDSGLIQYTNDGGQSWTDQTSGVSEVLQGVRFVNNQTGWAVGSNGTILHTTNGGTTWGQQTAETTETLTDVWVAADQTSGWISGYNGVLLTFGNGTPPTDPPNPGEADIRVPEDFATIQAAIDAAQSGQTIRVAAGTYVENIGLKENIAIIGAGAENTIIDGGGTDVIWAANGARVSGFTLTNGGDSGVFAWSTSPIIEHCIITNCDQGISTAADAIIRSNIIAQNTGYGIFVGTSSTIGRPASPAITNNLIIQNGSDGTGLTLYEAGGLVINNTIDANGTYGINVSKGSAPITIEIKNNLITNNGWYGINGYAFDTITQISNYNNVWNNAWDNYDDLQPGQNSGSEDPLYVNPLARPTSKRAFDSRTDMSEQMASARNHINDSRAKNPAARQFRSAKKQSPQTLLPSFSYHLQTSSPCIDAGDPLTNYNDQDGSRNDMGAYGGPEPLIFTAQTDPGIDPGTDPNIGEFPEPGSLPTGTRGPFALDLDVSPDDQQIVQSSSTPPPGQTITVDIVITEDGTGLNGVSVTLQFDPSQATYEGFEPTDVFASGVAIEDKGKLASGILGLNVAVLGSTTTSKAKGSIGQATFKLLDTFNGETHILVIAGEIAQNGETRDIAIGSGGAFVVIGGDIPTTAFPTDPIERSDFSGNGVVDFGDFVAFASAFGKTSTDAGFDPRIDLNDNGTVDFPDFIQFAGLFGKSVSSGKTVW